jgi:hypothetical protein
MKGMFTQSACVLLDQPVALDEVGAALQAFDVVKKVEDKENKNWMFGGPSFVIAMRPEVNGYISVDAVDRPWPDHMGDPKKESLIFGAWSMGHFGPLVYPGNLTRAMQHAYLWPEARRIAPGHKGFLRIRASYVFGASGDAPVMPADYVPLPELMLVTEIAAALLGLDGALAYFNPNGESLRSRAFLEGVLQRRRDGGPLPFDLWCNVRLFNFGEDASAWMMMDTVGMHQLDQPDHEACFPGETYDLNRFGHFFYNLGGYLHDNGPVIKAGDTIDGPGNINWRGWPIKHGKVAPPRAVFRWFPQDGSKPPKELLADLET